MTESFLGKIEIPERFSLNKKRTMKHIIYLYALLASISATGQEFKAVPALQPGTEFTLKASPAGNSSYYLSIASQKPYDGPNSLSESIPFLEAQVPEDEIRGAFVTFESAGTSRTILRMKSGIPKEVTLSTLVLFDSINYDGLDLELYPNVERGDYWPGPVACILCGGLRPTDEQPRFVLKRDSTCLKNLGLSPEKADKLFRQQLRYIKQCYDDNQNVRLSKMEELEDQYASRSVERRYGYGISESMYPNTRKYILEPHPKEYIRVECPYLSNDIAYFTEKGNDRILVTLWEWSKFSGAPFSPEDPMDKEPLKKAFREKFETLRRSITEIMGDPATVKLNSEQPYEEKFRDSIVWHAENGAEIRLTFDGRADGSSYDIDLWIYRE